MKHRLWNFAIVALVAASCQFAHKNTNTTTMNNYEKGTFGWDLDFLQKKDRVVLLENGDAKVIVSLKYQGKVFTSTAQGLSGKSFGWVNYAALQSDKLAEHINAYGGEERMWIGPEGGQFSIFFKKGSQMVFDNWFTPSALDTEPWELETRSATGVSMTKELQLVNYSGTRFQARIHRDVQLLGADAPEKRLGVAVPKGVKWVGFETANTLKNTGSLKWDAEKGTVCIWMLSMFSPSEQGTIVIPYRQGEEQSLGKIATTNYFGEIPKERIKMENGLIYFKVDGKHRSKLGLSYQRSTPLAASYDAIHKVLTILRFSLPAKEEQYINQLWEIQKEPFKGDVINAYNDGPLEDGSQMGPFFEMESSSPAAFLAPGEEITHTQSMFHFVGEEAELDQIAQKLLHVSVAQIKSALK